ncbi:lytic transglycosylase domain-containing protein [Sphingomonas ginkgonis]|uniref:Lytic transglycosylase domain-containing protein n=1 Tax=Sphingomonas ginkgonis TaxID=2315330 RepID=A0A3R9YNG9_9SPHN|nr:lytic transglycosylase domain-containing protein [Sphingomonas ginkgonis]RST31505.1 lytic transglycosylase domain-containing protein [Sphingomonas ginkgonis]
MLPALAALAAAVLSIATPAAATVYEIAADGSLHQRVGGQSVAETDAAAGEDVSELAPVFPAAAMTLVAEPVVPATYRASLHSAADRYSVSPSLLAALTRQESGWRATAISPRGAIGLTQLMPATARALAVDARDPAANLDGGARYLRQMLDRFDGDVERALAAYNSGPGRVIRAAGIPAIAETRAYVSTIIDRLGEPIDLAGRNDR